MGVWIETSGGVLIFGNIGVTPCMGVWIETYKNEMNGIYSTSHPVWVCGLKLDYAHIGIDRTLVTPCMGVWIETVVNGT